MNPNDFNSASLALLKYLPKISSASQNPILFFKPSSQNYIEYTVRGDQKLSSKDHLTLRYFYDRYDQKGVLDTTNLLTDSDQATIRYHSALVSEQHIFSASKLNNFIISSPDRRCRSRPVAGAPSVKDLVSRVDEIQPDERDHGG